MTVVQWPMFALGGATIAEDFAPPTADPDTLPERKRELILSLADKGGPFQKTRQ